MDGAGSTTLSGALLKALIIHGAVDLFGSAMELPAVGGAERLLRSKVSGSQAQRGLFHHF